MWRRFGLGGLMAIFLAGCMSELENQTKAEGKSIIGKTTQKIEKFDPKAKKEVSKSEVKVEDPITGPLTAYRPIIERTAKLQIEHAVKLFHGLEGRYPKDYDEFMEKIIKANSIKLPVLDANGVWQYQYDEENHELKVVKVK